MRQPHSIFKWCCVGDVSLPKPHTSTCSIKWNIREQSRDRAASLVFLLSFWAIGVGIIHGRGCNAVFLFLFL